MKISEILQNTAHRPWKMAQNPWKYYQEWNDAVFLHWKVDPIQLLELVPKDLEIQVINNSAWVSLVAFNMEKIRPRYFPAFPPISNFHEINIRTYVKFKEKTGVYFLSIEGSKIHSCKIAKSLSELPYQYSKMKRNEGNFFSENKILNNQFDLKYKVGKKQDYKSELDLFLTERYALFQDSNNRLNEFEIHHIPWPFYEVEIKKLSSNYSEFPDFFQNQPDLAHYSPGVQVIAWDKTSFILQ